MEYELLNNKSCIEKIKICPEISIIELKDKIMNLIPRRTLFLNKDKIIDASQEDNIEVKQIIKNIVIIKVIKTAKAINI